MQNDFTLASSFFFAFSVLWLSFIFAPAGPKSSSCHYFKTSSCYTNINDSSSSSRKPDGVGDRWVQWFLFSKNFSHLIISVFIFSLLWLQHDAKGGRYLIDLRRAMMFYFRSSDLHHLLHHHSGGGSSSSNTHPNNRRILDSHSAASVLGLIGRVFVLIRLRSIWTNQVRSVWMWVLHVAETSVWCTTLEDINLQWWWLKVFYWDAGSVFMSCTIPPYPELLTMLLWSWWICFCFFILFSSSVGLSQRAFWNVWPNKR